MEFGEAGEEVSMVKGVDGVDMAGPLPLSAIAVQLFAS